MTGKCIATTSWAAAIAIIAIAGVFSANAFAAPPTITVITPTPVKAAVTTPEPGMDIVQLQPPNTREGKEQRSALNLPDNVGGTPKSADFYVYLSVKTDDTWQHLRTVHITLVSHSMSDAHTVVNLTYKVNGHTYDLKVLWSSPSTIKTGDYGVSGLTIRSPLLGASIRTAALTTTHEGACVVAKTTITIDRTKESATKKDQICWK